MKLTVGSSKTVSIYVKVCLLFWYKLNKNKCVKGSYKVSKTKSSSALWKPIQAVHMKQYFCKFISVWIESLFPHYDDCSQKQWMT